MASKSPATIIVQNVNAVIENDFKQVNGAVVKDKALRRILQKANKLGKSHFIITQPEFHQPDLITANVIIRQGRVIGVPPMRQDMTPFETGSRLLAADYQSNTLLIASGGVSLEASDLLPTTSKIGEKVLSMLNVIIDNRIGLVIGIGNKRESGIGLNGEHPPWETNPLAIYQSPAILASWKHMLRTCAWGGVQEGGADVNTRYLPAFRNYVLEVDWCGRLRELTANDLKPVYGDDATLPINPAFGQFSQHYGEQSSPYLLRISYEKPLDTLFDSQLSDVVIWKPFMRYRKSSRDQPGYIPLEVLTQLLSIDLMRIDVIDWTSGAIIRSHRFVMIEEKTWRDNDVLFDIVLPDGQVWYGDLHMQYLLSVIQRFFFYPSSTDLDVSTTPTHRAIVHCHAGIGRTGVVTALLANFSPAGQANLKPWELIMQMRYARLLPMVFTPQQWAFVYYHTILNPSAVSYCTSLIWLACGALRLEYLLMRALEGGIIKDKDATWRNALFKLLEDVLITPYRHDKMSTGFAKQRLQDVQTLIKSIPPTRQSSLTINAIAFDPIGSARMAYYNQNVRRFEYARCVLSWQSSSSSAIYTLPQTTIGILQPQEYVLDLQQLLPSHNITLLTPTAKQLKSRNTRINTLADFDSIVPYAFLELSLRINANGENQSSVRTHHRRHNHDDGHYRRRRHKNIGKTSYSLYRN